ncbi:gluconolactonase [Amylibacter marinus]|uniref:Gluconolactonase n=1 Tax=Amylibacter marinus TaxID=1475483 RepID=A0ABQ5VUB3_9RHOB|nr:SMP-30/gluconolactonase/LRE family protein [Amylibacter marinus]GLQ34841.1 gluconolactonase [Amylibacter marinus]
MIAPYDPRNASLGEGPLWHPERAQLFWFDINNNTLLSRTQDGPAQWQFDRPVSAAGWVSHDELLIASATDLFVFNVETTAQRTLCGLEVDNSATRSNDGRADPWGGFWIGTMGRQAEAQAGAIYRYHRGVLTRLYSDITISNAICFSPDKSSAYFADTPRRQIMRVSLDSDGWPMGAPEVFVDLSEQGYNPDGAVVDSTGHLWNAQWGAGRVARYAPDGAFVSAVEIPAAQATCPAFGGADYKTLFVTSASEGMVNPSPEQGQVFSTQTAITGQREHAVIL